MLETTVFGESETFFDYGSFCCDGWIFCRKHAICTDCEIFSFGIVKMAMFLGGYSRAANQ